MLGLLMKDFLTLKKYLKTIFFTLLIYAVCGYISDNLDMLISFSTVLFSMITVTSIAYDENAHWNSYALTMPVSHNMLVLSKYILGCLLCMLGTVISLAVAILIFIVNNSLFDNFETLLVIAATGIIIGLLFISIYLPFAFKFGVEKSRIIMVSIFLVPSIIIGITYKIAPEVINKALNALPILETNPAGTLISVTIGILIILTVSFIISAAIFKKKEF